MKIIINQQYSHNVFIDPGAKENSISFRMHLYQLTGLDDVVKCS